MVEKTKYCLSKWRLLVVALMILAAKQVWGCYIWGTDSGECAAEGLIPLWRATNMPFCQKAVNYPVCVPKFTVSS